MCGILDTTGTPDLALGACSESSIADRSVCPSYGLPGCALACSTYWPPGARALAVRDRDLDAELMGAPSLAFANAFDLRGVEGTQVVSRIFRTFDQATASVCMTCGW